ncbi:MAG: hypothetical protein IBJ09_11145 [Bacteroidia bacterium]|nr:hypothetical protein [Bacteroidia bacterium]
MSLPQPHLIQKLFRSLSDPDYNRITFPEHVIEIHIWGLNLSEPDLRSGKTKKRRYIIELHLFDGFSMVKFYPHCQKNNPKKYQLREEELGYRLSKRNIFAIIYTCAILMHDYLNRYPDCFAGYIGIPDKKDNAVTRRRTLSQRASIYHLLTNSVFVYPKYKLSSKSVFDDINLRLIRKVRSKQEGKITRAQMENYRKFLAFFQAEPERLYSLMTAETRKKFQ